MLESIIAYGLAMGAIYALIGITYNVMFTASRVFSFTAGMVGMLGGVLGALFICLIPTTIGGLLSAIGIAGMDRVMQHNVLAMSGKAVEAAGGTVTTTVVRPEPAVA